MLAELEDKDPLLDADDQSLVAEVTPDSLQPVPRVWILPASSITVACAQASRQSDRLRTSERSISQLDLLFLPLAENESQT